MSTVFVYELLSKIRAQEAKQGAFHDVERPCYSTYSSFIDQSCKAYRKSDSSFYPNNDTICDLNSGDSGPYDDDGEPDQTK